MKISADFGITVTDTLRKKEKELIHKMDLSSNVLDHHRVKELFPEIDFTNKDGFLAVTGGRHLELGNQIDAKPIIHVNEIEAIGEGTMSLSGLNTKESVIIVSAGSGTACIHALDGIFTHCSGTGVGGGTVLGLSKLLLGTQDPSEIAVLAENGNESKVDLILEDVVTGPIGQLPSTTTAVNFGKVSKLDIEYSREDIAAGIINLVGQTAARIATSVAMMFKANQIVVVGRAPSFNGLKKSLEEAALITGFTPHFPKNGEYASALGAMLVAEKNPPN
jgi:type II pantothenate kinase